MYDPYKPAYTTCPTCHRDALASTCSRSEADRAIAAHEAHGGYLYAAPAPRIVTMDAHVRDADAGRDHLGRYVRLPSQLQAERADSDATRDAA